MFLRWRLTESLENWKKKQMQISRIPFLLMYVLTHRFLSVTEHRDQDDLIHPFKWIDAGSNQPMANEKSLHVSSPDSLLFLPTLKESADIL